MFFRFTPANIEVNRDMDAKRIKVPQRYKSGNNPTQINWRHTNELTVHKK